MKTQWRLKRRSQARWGLVWISVVIGVVLWANLHLLSCITDNKETKKPIADQSRKCTTPAVRHSIDIDPVKLSLTVDHRKALLYGNMRQNESYLTIGIPTVRRQGVDYLEKTLQALIANTKVSQQRKDIVVVVFMVDKNDTWSKHRARQLSLNYPHLIQNGFLQIIHPHDQSMYPDYSKLKRTFNDSLERVAWRTKQNVDYAYLFSYSKNISKYYMQLEDDVITAKNYFEEMVKFINASSDIFWYCLEFSSLGFIGKLFRSSDLQELSEYILMFYDEQPGDLLLNQMKKIKTQWNDIKIKKALFQHDGVVSSMSNKRQFMTDSSFKDKSSSYRLSRKRFYHVNPSAIIDTSINTYSDNEPVYAYDLSDRYFWGVMPNKGDYFRITFESPQNISRIFIDSGYVTKATDMLHSADLLASTSTADQDCRNTTSIATFVAGDVDTKNKSLPYNIHCLVIQITANQTDWVIIREVAIFLLGEPLIEESDSNKKMPYKLGESKMMKWQMWKRSDKIQSVMREKLRQDNLHKTHGNFKHGGKMPPGRQHRMPPEEGNARQGNYQEDWDQFQKRLHQVKNRNSGMKQKSIRDKGTNQKSLEQNQRMEKMPPPANIEHYQRKKTFQERNSEHVFKDNSHNTLEQENREQEMEPQINFQVKQGKRFRQGKNPELQRQRVYRDKSVKQVPQVNNHDSLERRNQMQQMQRQINIAKNQGGVVEVNLQQGINQETFNNQNYMGQMPPQEHIARQRKYRRIKRNEEQEVIRNNDPKALLNDKVQNQNIDIFQQNRNQGNMEQVDNGQWDVQLDNRPLAVDLNKNEVRQNNLKWQNIESDKKQAKINYIKRRRNLD